MQYFLFADSTFTVVDVVRVMDKVTSDERWRREVWEEVLMWDDRTPSSYLDEVYSSDKEKTPLLADVYVHVRPKSSWEDLAKSLYSLSELAAVKEARSFLQQSGG